MSEIFVARARARDLESRKKRSLLLSMAEHPNALVNAPEALLRRIDKAEARFALADINPPGWPS